jgi:hypothetical protein
MRTQPERNNPCPCGSGKKYKKCCGPESGRKPLDINALNRSLAYKGHLGRQRESWCKEYLAFKRENIAEVDKIIKEDVAAAGRAITCHKGCVTCCGSYVVASLQECEGIVYWLYQHEDILSRFLISYEEWRLKINEISELFNRVFSLQDRAISHPTTDEEKIELMTALADFMGRNIACPFLSEGACVIYEVRPFVCAGVIATTPPEWCLQAHPRHPEVVLFKADARFENDMPYFLRLKNNVSYGCVPAMVQSLLQGGWDTLSTVPGLEWLNGRVYQDPEIKAAMLRAGYLPSEKKQG